MELDDQDIKRLDQKQLTRLAHRLLLNEARKNNIPAHSIECSFNITTGDGGEDASINWSEGVERTGYLERNTLVQVKATPMAKANCMKELVGEDGKLKPKVEELFKSGGTYVLFCNRDHKNQVDAFKQVAKHYGYENPSIRSYNPTKIATWANEYFAVIAFVHELTGRPLPAGLQTWECWSRLPTNSHLDFISNEILTGYVAELRDASKEKNSVVRICGASGLGKSRLAVEAFAREDLSRVTTFIDANAREDLGDIFTNWLRNSMEGILVVDNCPAGLHQRLSEISRHPDSGITLVTINFDTDHFQNGQKYIQLEPMEPSVIEGIVRKKYPDLPLEEVNQIVEFSEGFPRMAVLLCESDLRQSGSFSSVTPPDLVAKLLFPEGRVNEAEREVISACALFDKFAFDDGQAGETEHIARRLCSDMSAIKFAQIAMKFKKRNILEPHMGAFTKVTPRPLAWHLASVWWESCSNTLAELLIDEEWPASLAQAMCNQLTYLSDVPAAHRVAEKLCAPNCPFATAKSLNTKRGSRLFCELVEVNPDATLACLERVLLPLSTAEVKGMVDGRRYLVWAIEKLCWKAVHFQQAAFLLARLAEAENETRISNNATGQLKKLFHIFLPGTQADLTQRLNLIDEMYSGSISRELIVDCLCSGFFYGSFNRTSGRAERQRGGIPEVDFKPSGAEIEAYWKAILSRLLPELQDEAARKKILGQLSSMFLYLVRFGFIDLLITIVNDKKKYDASFWVKGLEALIFARREAAEKLSSDAQRDIDILIQSLEPKSFEEKYQFLVAHPSFSNFERGSDGELLPINAPRATAFGEECGKTWPSWSSHLPLLLSGEQREGSAFAIGLHATLEHAQQFIDSCLDILSRKDEHSNPVVLAEYIAILNSTNRPIVEAFIREIESNPTLHEYSVWLLCRIGISNESIELLVRMLNDHKIELQKFAVLRFGGVLKSVSHEKMNVLLRQLKNHETANMETNIMLLELIHMYVFQDSVNWPAVQPFTRELLMTDGLLRSLEETQLYDWVLLVRKILDSKKDKEFVQSISREILLVCSDENSGLIYQFDRSLQPLLNQLLCDYFDDCWPVLGSALNSENDRLHFGLLTLLTNSVENMLGNSKQPILEAPQDKLANWLVENETATLLLTRYLKLWSFDMKGNSGLTELGALLFDKYGRNKRFLEVVSANLASVGGTGSLLPEYEARYGLMLTLESHKLLAIKRWAAREKIYYQNRISGAKKRDEELKHGIFDGWNRDF